MITPTKEDYLRAIEHLEEKLNRNVKSIELAKYMKLAKSTVSERVKELTKEGLIKNKKYSSLEFTKKGLKIARKLTYKHRIIETFLHNVLKISKDMIHEEANRLEHAFSDEAIERMRIFLKNPKYCPHGQSISKISLSNNKNLQS